MQPLPDQMKDGESTISQAQKPAKDLEEQKKE
jgi:hypothetical protein